MSPRLPLRNRSRRFRMAAAGVLTVAGGAVVVGLFLPRAGSSPPHTAAKNISRDFRACLVTDDPDQTAARAGWSGLREAARAAPVNTQRLITPRTATTTEALLPYVESLVQRKCGVIVSAGRLLDGAARDAARTHPRQRFVITSGAASGLPNTTTLASPTSDTVAAAVRAASRTSASGSS
ncbi:hypothetical protein [Actinacidiphila acidipaludis]|uniref:BMP family ABC transporter substrate-binding protein n=1 Tax=Actinacidiphila acidipaludis TaxID=2873382 RepID=A0ABS7QAP3_9ACTN|nr:hypothetical protein [Streptomyces acidipaludis]MBY8879931.1 hypothetical protein [Streptomyces acidipaludis]